MDQPNDGRSLDRSAPVAGSVRRARERALAGLPRQELPMRRPQMMQGGPEPEYNPTPLRPMPPSGNGQSRMRQPGPPPNDARSAKANHDMSTPLQAPQWPLAPPPLSPVSSNASSSYQPPPGRPRHAPERPPRPTQIPPIVNEPRLQQPIPATVAPLNVPDRSQYRRDENNTLTPAAPSSRLTSSSVGTIPEFPVPVAEASNAASKRNTANLGPPPSSRRGASSYYSTASYVSPIPEESPRTRSHGSYASSAAMPEAWGSHSPSTTPGGDAFYDESATEKSRDSIGDDFVVDDESKLVRSASLGKRAKAALVTTKSPANAQTASRPTPSPVQSGDDNSQFYDVSTGSSGTLPTMRPTPVTTPGTRPNPAITADGMLGIPATAAASSSLPGPGNLSPSPRPSSRLAGLKRPPKLDIDAVRSMEARGSITSLPDLIRRATRLASMMDRGKRPGSRLDTLSQYLDEKTVGAVDEKEQPDERHRSGLSDMLAAFPPPASRGSWFRTTSWPLDPNQRQTSGGRGQRGRGLAAENVEADGSPVRRRRRCCGLPIWAFMLIVLVVICAIVAAVVVPLEFFVFKNLGNHRSTSDVERCEKQLKCLNGGTSVISGSGCSCLCTNGFAGADCSKGGNGACTTTNIASLDGSANVTDATLGIDIPRLIEDARANFSVPLVGTVIVTKFNSQNLSCFEQNALVTFDGRSTRLGDANDEVKNVTAQQGKKAATSNYATSTSTTLALAPPTSTAAHAPSSTAASPSGTPTGPPGPTFTVTEEVLDFARVAVLYLLQEESVDSAETAQTNLQDFFSQASQTDTVGGGATDNAASNINIGGNNTVNLVNLSLNIGEGAVGNKTAKRGMSYESTQDPKRRLYLGPRIRTSDEN